MDIIYAFLNGTDVDEAIAKHKANPTRGWLITAISNAESHHSLPATAEHPDSSANVQRISPRERGTASDR
ncbi:MAG: hypothetical protein ACFB2W_00785 [Leptolyngbyaceae cyanobacterium]